MFEDARDKRFKDTGTRSAERPRRSGHPSLDRILRRPEVLEVTGMSAATLYRWITEGSFPRPVRLGKNSVGWRASAVEDWLEHLEEVADVAS